VRSCITSHARRDRPSQGDLIREDKLLRVYCCDCCHERDINPATVPLPAETPVPEVKKHMKCSKCGSRKIDTRPELYPGGIEAMRERLREKKPVTESGATAIHSLSFSDEIARTRCIGYIFSN
jgi:hypothetical protein